MLKHILHVALAAFIVLGWAVVPRIHGPVAAAVLGHWLTNGGRCALSDEYGDSNGFTRSLVEGIGLPWPSATWAQAAIPYALLILPFSLSVLRSTKVNAGQSDCTSVQGASTDKPASDTTISARVWI